jgi:hypothetical protein
MLIFCEPYFKDLFVCASELTVRLSRRADQTARDGGGAKTTLPAHPAHEATL